MKRAILLDFETASTCDLKEAGAWRYAEDPNTEILCLCWTQLWDLQPGFWAPGHDGAALQALAEDPDVIFIAHNAGFEKAHWRRIMMTIFGFPDVPNERWHDTMAVCAMKAIPLKLEQAAAVLRLPIEKDMAGSRLTISLSKPHRKTGMFDRSLSTLAKVYTYCDNDVEAERGLHNRVAWQSPEERNVWLLDQTINERGVCLDLPFIRAAQQVVEGAMEPMRKRYRELTKLPVMQGKRVMEWLADNHCHIPNLQKETVIEWLGYDIDGSDPLDFTPEDWAAADLSPEVREVLTIKQTLASASVKKLGRMDKCVCSDGRVRGTLQYHAAGPGRWGGRLFQPQNFPRPTAWNGWKDPPSIDVVRQAIMTGDHEYVASLLGAPVEVVISALRHAIVADRDKLLVAGDFAGIEARVVLGLAGQHDKTKLLAEGLDPYCDFAGVVLGRPITKKDPERQLMGKPGVLGCGFQMGAKKLSFKYKVPMEMAQTIVDGYRQDWAPLVPKVWYGLQDAGIKTVWDGNPHEAFGVRYALEDGWLTARLPSGRKLWYWEPTKVRNKMPWDQDDVRPGFTYRAFKTGHMVTVSAYGGLLTENVVQALARDLMVSAMFTCERENMPVILTVHDEIVTEVDEHLADDKALRQIMEDRPQWAIDIGIPVSAETWAADCYRK